MSTVTILAIIIGVLAIAVIVLLVYILKPLMKKKKA